MNNLENIIDNSFPYKRLRMELLRLRHWSDAVEALDNMNARTEFDFDDEEHLDITDDLKCVMKSLHSIEEKLIRRVETKIDCISCDFNC